MLAGYIECSKIVGCDINIGDGAFVVDGETGAVTMNANTKIKYDENTETTVKEIDKRLTEEIKNINSTKMRRVEVYTHDALIFRDEGQTATIYCKIYEWDTDVTEKYKDNITWMRKSDNGDEKMQEGGETLTITRDKINFNASFYCKVYFND
jgi:uncharacterized alkaline shock family protein YloU